MDAIFLALVSLLFCLLALHLILRRIGLESLFPGIVLGLFSVFRFFIVLGLRLVLGFLRVLINKVQG
jgi:hypothetical protein